MSHTLAILLRHLPQEVTADKDGNPQNIELPFNIENFCREMDAELAFAMKNPLKEKSRLILATPQQSISYQEAMTQLAPEMASMLEILLRQIEKLPDEAFFGHADTTTFGQMRDVLKRYNLLESLK